MPAKALLSGVLIISNIRALSTTPSLTLKTGLANRVPYAYVTGVVDIPAIPSKPISFISISCPTANRAAASPADPPAASTPAAAKIRAPFLAPDFTIPPTNFPPSPAVYLSIIPITAPLPAALARIRSIASGSFSTFLTSSLVNFNPFSFNSSFKNSANDSPVSKVAPAAPIANGILRRAPGIAPIPPAIAPTPVNPAVVAPAAANEAGFTIAEIELTNN